MKKDTSKTKLSISATLEGIEKHINQYFYSTTYKVSKLDSGEYQITWLKGLVTDFSVEFSKGRFYFYSLNKQG